MSIKIRLAHLLASVALAAGAFFAGMHWNIPDWMR